MPSQVISNIDTILSQPFGQFGMCITSTIIELTKENSLSLLKYSPNQFFLFIFPVRNLTDQQNSIHWYFSSEQLSYPPKRKMCKKKVLT